MENLKFIRYLKKISEKTTAALYGRVINQLIYGGYNKGKSKEWNSLSEQEKKIVQKIAMQLPFSCEGVADIFINRGRREAEVTIGVIRDTYGFEVIL